jgi:hypothetical protein
VGAGQSSVLDDQVLVADRPALEGFALIQAGSYEEAVPILEESVRAFPAGTEEVEYAYAHQTDVVEREPAAARSESQSTSDDAVSGS